MKGSKHAIKFDDVETWCEVETPNDDHSDSTEDENHSALFVYKKGCEVLRDFKEAMDNDLSQWVLNNVYRDVPDEGQQYLTTRWVLTEKQGGIRKARLVIREFQDPDLADLIKDSPTCGRESFRIVITIASSSSWQCGIMDVKTAFFTRGTH